jgi:hypothetical protein
MARPQELEEPVRVNYVIEKRQDKALRELAYNTNRNLSELIRMAIDNFLEMDYDNVEKPVKGEIADVIKLLEHLKLKMKKTEVRTEWELKKSELSMLFGSQWWKLRSVVDMTVSSLTAKGIEAMHEEIKMVVDVPGTNRMKQEKYGFKLLVLSGLDKAAIDKLITLVTIDAKQFGYIKTIEEEGTGEKK